MDDSDVANLNDLAERFMAANGDREALFFSDRWYRTGELHGRAVETAAGLAALGVEPGDRVAVMMANSPDVQVAYAAIWRSAAVVTPVMFLVPPDELHKILLDSGAKAVITSPEFASNVLQAAQGVDSLEHVICTQEVEGTTSLDSLLGKTADPAPVSRDDLACILYTGGTTGQAKGVMLTHGALIMASEAAYDGADVIDDERTIDVLPLSHGYGMINILATMFVTGGIRVLLPWFEPTIWLQMVEQHRIRRASLVPTMIQMLLSAPLEDHDLSCLESINSGAAPLSPDVIAEFERRVPSCMICEGYGCTESGIVGAVNRRERRKIGSVGPPMVHYEIQAFDDNDLQLPADEIGEICIRSTANMLGYWNSPDATAEALRGGWLHTGDIGRVDEDGFVWIVDRKKDLIIRGGFNVFPRDVEDALLQHPAVEVAGVVGRPDDKYGEEVVAFVSVRGSVEVTEEELIEHCKQRIGRHKYPREVRITGYVPLTAVGKVDRKALRAML